MSGTNNQKVIIFGATGGVGAYVTLYLKEQGYDVVAVAKRESDNGFFEERSIEYLSIDVTRRSSFRLLPMDNVDSIIHLAGKLPATMKNYNPHEYINQNIEGTLNVLEYAAKCKVKRFVFPTTLSDVYHLCGSLNPIDPDVQRKFPMNSDHSVYAISKNAAVSLCQHYSNKYDFRCFIVRFANIFLWHPNPFYFVNGEKKRKGLYAIIEQARKGENIEIWGDPGRTRDVFYVKDCVQLLEKCLSSSSKGGLFNVGTGIGTSRLNQVLGILEVFGLANRKSSLVFRPDMPNSPQFMLDIQKTVQDLGFKPQYDYLSYLKDFKREMELNRFAKLWGQPEDYE